MISVIIPVLNESDTIGSVVEFARHDPEVKEVIVVDDGSIDETPEMAAAAVATVITSTLLGKGASMEDGMSRCQYRHPSLSRRLSGGLPPGGAARELALFDMDGTLLNGRFAVHLADRVGKARELDGLLDNLDLPAEERARRIAAIFTDVPRATFEQVAREVPLMPGARETVMALRKAGFQVGIVTDSYSVPSEIVRRRVFADFSIGHHLKFHKGVATGKLTFSPAMFHAEGCPHHVYCKRNAMVHLMDRLGIGPEHVLAVGDSENHICLLEAAGRSVALRPATKQVHDAAKCVVWGDLTEVVAMMQD